LQNSQPIPPFRPHYSRICEKPQAVPVSVHTDPTADSSGAKIFDQGRDPKDEQDQDEQPGDAHSPHHPCRHIHHGAMRNWRMISFTTNFHELAQVRRTHAIFTTMSLAGQSTSW
jgi:hypothetical protein